MIQGQLKILVSCLSLLVFFGFYGCSQPETNPTSPMTEGGQDEQLAKTATFSPAPAVCEANTVDMDDEIITAPETSGNTSTLSSKSAKSDGQNRPCGPFRNNRFVRQFFCGVDMRSSCVAHDQCYDNASGNQPLLTKCNDTFQVTMQGLCNFAPNKACCKIKAAKRVAICRRAQGRY